uniref:ALG-1 n=2 Tax=Caenorhabditis tropicalis TaxID=1561998 RepID=A0A1I7UEP0_9PELO
MQNNQSDGGTPNARKQQQGPPPPPPPPGPPPLPPPQNTNQYQVQYDYPPPPLQYPVQYYAPPPPVQNQLYVETGSYTRPPYRRRYNQPNELDPGMNGDGWQGPGGRGGHHMNGGGGRRGGGGYNQRMPQNQHHGGMNRMMPPAFRPQQQQYMPPYPPMGGMPEVMDLNMRMDGMSLASTPSQVMPGQYGDMGPPPQQWNQPPTPFSAPPPPQQEDLYDPTGGYGGHHQMPPYGQQQQQRGGQNQYGNRMQHGGGGGGNRGYQQRQQNYNMQPMMVPSNQSTYYGGNQNHQQQPSYAPSPFSMGGGSQTPHDQHMGGGGHGPNGNFGGAASSMDDYSMWTDENDEEAKRKKTLRDKGLLAWGDAEASNSKPIRRWLVPDGQEEDFETAMERCPSHLKKKALNEEALRRRLGSDNPQVVAQAQQQAEEEASATMKIGRRPIIPCGWGDLPSELVGDKSEKSSEYDQGSSKGWDDGSLSGGGRHQQHHDDNSLWNNPSVGGPSSNETRNPFFAQHMQQQHHHHQQQHQHQHFTQGVYGDNGVLDGGSVWSAVIDGSSMGPPPMGGGPSSSSTSMPMGMLMMNAVGGSSADEDGSQKKLADNLKLAVEKGHLDISLLSLPHIPPNVLDLLTEILTVIPRLDSYEDELKTLGANRPSNSEEGKKEQQDLSWMNEDQKNEHEKAVIGVVTAKIEVTQLSKKITEALIEAGLIPAPPAQCSTNQNHSHGGPPGPPGPDGAGSSTGGDSFNNSGGPPDHYYDYSFLG